MFPNLDEHDTENAFVATRDVLNKFSCFSPQAEHYYDVLSSFAEAITQRRKQVAEDRRRATSQYLDQILTINFSGGQDRQITAFDSIAAGPSNPEEISLENWWNSEFPSVPGILDNPPDILTANWDALALQISENFPIEDDPPTRLFNPV